jgi:hypothetical protein
VTKPKNKEARPKPRQGGEMCSIDKDGRLTNGEIMLTLLGDEPDVSHTSLALAKKLGMSEQVLKMLGATPADLEVRRTQTPQKRKPTRRDRSGG